MIVTHMRLMTTFSFQASQSSSVTSRASLPIDSEHCLSMGTSFTPSKPTSTYGSRGTSVMSSPLTSPPHVSPVPSTSRAGESAFTEPSPADLQDTIITVPTLPQSSTLPHADELIEYTPSLSEIHCALSKFREILPKGWVPVADQIGFHLLLLSSGLVLSVQREVFITFGGEEIIRVHCEPLSFAETFLEAIDLPRVKFEEASLDDFFKRALKIVQTLMQYKICVGANHAESRDVWSEIPGTYIDLNPYQEECFTQTCRAVSCPRLLKHGKRLRCDACNKVMNSLKRRSDSLVSADWSPFTPNVHLSSKQKLEKMQAQSEELKRRAAKILYHKNKINEMLDKVGVDVDADLHADLHDCLSAAKNLTETQKMFLEQQMKCASKSDPRGFRWHPSMIRLALHIRMISPAAYEAFRDSGVIKLPSQKTLYDYSHAFAPQAGVNDGLLSIVKKKIAEMKEAHQKYVALLVDEMYVSKNLVYRKSDNALIGYVHLNHVEEEMQRLENSLKGTTLVEPLQQLATKMLTYMVKGLTSNLKYVVASFPVNQLTKDMLYVRTWKVISRLERIEAKVLAIVSDGSAVNRAFISMHQPLTPTKSVVFDTINFCAPDRRPIYFIADVAHLMKTIRNCFYNSGEGGKKVRCMVLNGQKIEWKTIVRLYLSYKKCNFRKAFKLNSKNVFPNSYSCMNVKDAVHVLSRTVATDIELQKWEHTEETVKFIRRWDRFFDCLNGLHFVEHLRKKKPDLAPYMEVNDPRFDFLESCIDYLEEWTQQVQTNVADPTQREKAQLSFQTRQGIEIAIRGFKGAVTYLLKAGAKYVMARAFSQDALENYFSKQRARGGGSTNPNVDQFLHQSVSIGIQHDLGIRRKGANIEQGSTGMQLSDEPLPKRRKKK